MVTLVLLLALSLLTTVVVCYTCEDAGTDSLRKLTHTVTVDKVKREFTYYIPPYMCDRSTYISYLSNVLKIDTSDYNSDGSNIVINDEDTRLVVPLMVSLHGFTADSTKMLAKWSSIADVNGFVLIAPEGLNNSWNAVHCCGESLKKHVSDDHFISDLIDHTMHLSQNVFQQAADDPSYQVDYQSLDSLSALLQFAQFRGDAVMIEGESNGGFMTDLVALERAKGCFGKDPPRIETDFTLAANLVAENYDPDSVPSCNGEEESVPHNPIPKLILHGLDDGTVDAKGCCSDTKCCCDIADHSPQQCFSAQNSFDWWADWNGCSDSTSFDALKQAAREEPLMYRSLLNAADTIQGSQRNLTQKGSVIVTRARADSTHECVAPVELILVEPTDSNPVEFGHHMGEIDDPGLEPYPLLVTDGTIARFYQSVCEKSGGAWTQTLSEPNNLGFNCECDHGRYGHLCLNDGSDSVDIPPESVSGNRGSEGDGSKGGGSGGHHSGASDEASSADSGESGTQTSLMYATFLGLPFFAWLLLGVWMLLLVGCVWFFYLHCTVVDSNNDRRKKTVSLGIQHKDTQYRVSMDVPRPGAALSSLKTGVSGLIPSKNGSTAKKSAVQSSQGSRSKTKRSSLKKYDQLGSGKTLETVDEVSEDELSSMPSDGRMLSSGANSQSNEEVELGTGVRNDDDEEEAGVGNDMRTISLEEYSESE